MPAGQVGHRNRILFAAGALLGIAVFLLVFGGFSLDVTNDAFCRPALADTGADFSGYEVIFLGFPVWWYSIPAIIRSFVEAYDFSGKVIVPFATSGSSGMGRSGRDIQRLCPGAKVQPGKLLNGHHEDAELKAWMDKY